MGSAYRASHPLHKFYNYTVVHISELIERRHHPLVDFLDPAQTKAPKAGDNRVLVIDCITNYAEIPPASPTLERVDSAGSAYSYPPQSPDMEILVRALCAQKGWNALISRRKRGCLACAIREAGALGWKVIIRVE